MDNLWNRTVELRNDMFVIILCTNNDDSKPRALECNTDIAFEVIK